jgi:hypothetical protein
VGLATSLGLYTHSKNYVTIRLQQTGARYRLIELSPAHQAVKYVDLCEVWECHGRDYEVSRHLDLDDV